jgi:hypothetical protein
MKKFIFYITILLLAPAFLHAQWDVSPGMSDYQYTEGQSFTVEVALTGSGTDIDALGMDFSFPDDLLQFDGSDFTGTLMESWMFKQVSELNANTQRIAGFTTTGIISPPATGTLVKLNFTVKAGASGNGLFTIAGFTDDLASATSTAANFSTSGTPPAGWDIRTADSLYTKAPGDTFSVHVALSGTGDDIDALGLDFHFPEDILTFREAVFAMTLMESWMFKEASLLEPDTIRVAGFTTTGIITAPAAGSIVELKFEVKAGATGMGYMYFDGFTDDIATATTDSSVIQIESMPTGLYVQPGSSDYEYPAGTSFTVGVDIGNVTSDIDALGFDFHYPDALLQYDGSDFTGTVMNAWMFKQVSELTTNTLRIAGFTTTGLISTAGQLVNLNFTVKAGATGEGQFYLDGFTDDITGADTQSANFKVGSGVGVEQSPALTAASYEFHPNYPNPFNPETVISYEIARSGPVELEIINLRGESIRSFNAASQSAGSHQVIWDGRDSVGNDVSSGIYLYRIRSGEFNKTHKMMLIR